MITLCIIIDIIIIIRLTNIYKNKQITSIKSNVEKNKIMSNYETKRYIMTNTEKQFYKLLEKSLNDNNMNILIFPQINLENIIQAKNNDFSKRNRIKSRSIDYTLVSKENFKIICCIELDDYTHNYSRRIKRDIFINQLFKEVNIKLLRIRVNKSYDMNKIIEKIKEVV